MHEGEAPPGFSHSGKDRHGPRHTTAIVMACLLGGAIFGLDLLLPLGMVTGTPYAIMVMLSWFAGGQLFTLAISAAATLLTLAGHQLSRPGAAASADLANRTIAIATIWCIAILLMLIRRREEEKECARPDTRYGARDDRVIAQSPGRLEAARMTDMELLAGTAAHELRNPLGIIVTSISVITFKARQTGLDISAPLDRAKRAVARCETIIDEYLDAARAKGHQPKKVNLDQWLAGVICEIPEKAGIVLVADLQAPGEVSEIDPESFRRVLINLIDNACEAVAEIPDGGLVTIRSRALGTGLEIIIADNGPGIPSDLLPRVTDPLFSTKPHGTGLGLPTVQRVIGDHGGSMAIESSPGRGTRVILRLVPGGQ